MKPAYFVNKFSVSLRSDDTARIVILDTQDKDEVITTEVVCPISVIRDLRDVIDRSLTQYDAAKKAVQ